MVSENEEIVIFKRCTIHNIVHNKNKPCPFCSDKSKLSLKESDRTNPEKRIPDSA